MRRRPFCNPTTADRRRPNRHATPARNPNERLSGPARDTQRAKTIPHPATTGLIPATRHHRRHSQATPHPHRVEETRRRSTGRSRTPARRKVDEDEQGRGWSGRAARRNWVDRVTVREDGEVGMPASIDMHRDFRKVRPSGKRVKPGGCRRPASMRGGHRWNGQPRRY